MTMHMQELTLFGGWAKVQILKPTELGVSRSLVVHSVSISQIEVKPFSSFLQRQRSLLFNRRVKASLLLLRTQMTEMTISLGTPTQAVPSSDTVQTLLHKKTNRIYEAAQVIEQQELWPDEDVKEEHVGPILVTVRPLELATDQIHRVWIARLELRERIKQFHRQKYFLLDRSSQAAKDFLFFLGDEYLIKNKKL